MAVNLLSNGNKMIRITESIFGKKNIKSRNDFIRMSREGIPMSTLSKIQEITTLSIKEISQILPVSERQLTRYKSDHILRKDISSHLIQLVELFERGFEVFGKDKFPLWIRSEIRALGNQRPIDILDTPIGIQMVLDILGRIEHGVYS